ncbi:22717_t:CDS:2, partial [Dentiscutata erythropus]
MWTGNIPQILACEIIQYHAKIFLFDNSQTGQFKDDPFVNSASVEHLFSDRFIHSKHRVRLNEKKVMKVAQLRANQQKERIQKLDIKKLKSQQVHNNKQKGNLYSNNNVNTNSKASVNMNSEASVNMNSE